MLRSTMIVIGTVAVAILLLGLQIPVPYAVVTFSLLVMTLFNGLLYRRLTRSSTMPVTDNELFLQLGFDVMILAVILYFTGGATNPFISLFIIPIVISVTVLPRRYAWWLVFLTVSLYTALLFFYQPIVDEHTGHTDGGFSGHLVGMWVAFIVSAGIVVHFIYAMGETLRKQRALLAEARERDLRDQKLLTLGTLAASTAHEMGTPLGSMRLLVSEIKNELSDIPPQVAKDLQTLHVQMDRCATALSELSAAAGQAHLLGGSVLSVDTFLLSLRNDWLSQREGISVQCDWNTEAQAGKILSDQGLRHAIVNILNNAADASPVELLWQVRIIDHSLRMKICDRGPGMSDEMREQIGRQPVSTKDTGMGLGLFLAYGVIERFGGRVEMEPREGGGLCSTISLPLQAE